MAVTTALHLRGMRSTAERWSFVAFLLAALGLAASVWLIAVSQTETDEVRWWLVAAPLVVAAIPLVVPRVGVRIAAAIVLGTWCFVAVFSIGTLLVPALLAAVVAAVKGS